MKLHYFTSNLASDDAKRIANDFANYATPEWSCEHFIFPDNSNKDQIFDFRRQRLIDYLKKTTKCHQPCLLIEENTVFHSHTFISINTMAKNGDFTNQLIITDCEVDFDCFTLLLLSQEKYQGSINGIHGLINLNQLNVDNLHSVQSWIIFPEVRKPLLDLLENFDRQSSLDGFMLNVFKERKLEILVTFPYITNTTYPIANQHSAVIQQAFSQISMPKDFPKLQAAVTNLNNSSRFLAEIIALKLTGNLFANNQAVQ